MKTCVFIKNSLLFLIFLKSACCQYAFAPWISGDYYELEAMPVAVGSAIDLDDNENQMSSTIWRTVSHFQCRAPRVNSTTLLLYGTKAWTFPTQDVNLTLTYPSENAELFRDPIDKDVDHIITEFKVILHIDGVEVRGFITDGGILKESISLTFVSHDITSLAYQFWLYGTTMDVSDIIGAEPVNVHFLCN